MLRICRIQGLIKNFEPLFEGQRLRGTGSGCFITVTCSILTNWHVVGKCKGISFTPTGGKALMTKLVVIERSKELALLRAPFAPAGIAAFRFLQQLDRSEELLVIDYPLHGKVAIKPILTSGRVAMVNAERGLADIQ